MAFDLSSLLPTQGTQQPFDLRACGEDVQAAVRTLMGCHVDRAKYPECAAIFLATALILQGKRILTETHGKEAAARIFKAAEDHQP